MDAQMADAPIERIMATGDATAIALLERFLDSARENCSTRLPGQDDGMEEVMHALYALNRHLNGRYPDRFPAGFFVGDEIEVHRFVKRLLSSLFSERQVIAPGAPPPASRGGVPRIGI